MVKKAKKQRGWHANGGKPPHAGKGKATVDPIRRKKDVRAIKRYLSGRLRDTAVFTLGINVGLRGSDLLRLRWKDVLTPKGDIVRSLSVTESKNKNHRRIALGTNARRALQDLLDEVEDSYNDEDYIFPSRKGGQKMSIGRLHQLVNEWCTGAGVKGHFGSHTLRKTYGYFLYKQGTDITLLMKAFGHSSQAVTIRYIGIDQQQVDEANLRLNL